MSIYKPAPADAVPAITLSAWRVYRIKSKLRKLNNGVHLVGRNEAVGDGRVSSALKKWNPETREGITRSGRVYTLVGEPGGSLDAAHVWSIWCKVNKVTSIQDVTARYAKIRKPKKRVLTPKIRRAAA